MGAARKKGKTAKRSRAEFARRLLSYDRVVFDSFLRSAIRRGWAEATRDRGTGHLSTKNTLVHILNVHEAWLVAAAQDRWDVMDADGRRPEELRSWIEVREYRKRVYSGVDVLLGQLSDRRLTQRVQVPWMPGRYTLEDAFLQVSMEQAHHLGELIATSWQSDRAPPSMTWIENRPG